MNISEFFKNYTNKFINNYNQYINNLINMKFFSKEPTKNFLYNQVLILLIIVLFGTVLTYKKISPIQTVFAVNLYFFCIYIFHRFSSYKKNMKYYLFKSDKPVLNIMSYSFLVFLIYLVQKISEFDFIPLPLLLFLYIITITANIFNGKQPNKNLKNCNYGPDTLDHLFGTNCNEKFINYSLYIPNIIFSFMVVSYLYNT